MKRLAFACLLALAACNPVQSDEVAALGGETPGVRRGPLHRPGQPCLACHTGDVGDPPAFSVAGTVFQSADSTTAASGAQVLLENSDGTSTKTSTNSAGNFYLSPNEFTPVWPMKVQVTFGGVTAVMTSEIGRDGSCAKCHSDPAGPTSVGHVYIPPDGGAP